ncbi:MAG: APC family permease [Thermodesulfobacteriota bacterium]|nr:APC family permease [Thermodesulfobacteriota bacterium]
MKEKEEDRIGIRYEYIPPEEFINEQKAGSIACCDLLSTAYYILFASMIATGLNAPWLILVVMLFTLVLRYSYIESCLIRSGGVYVLASLGFKGTLAKKVGASALLIDYVLTVAMSSVSAGFYGTNLINKLLTSSFLSWLPCSNFESNQSIRYLIAVFIALIITTIFIRLNLTGIRESSTVSQIILRINIVVIGLCCLLGVYTVIRKGIPLPPFHIKGLNTDTFWCVPENFFLSFGLLTKIILEVVRQFANSVLALSGFESMGQIVEKIETPKVKNTKRAFILLTLPPVILTTSSAFLGIMIMKFKMVNGMPALEYYREALLCGLARYVIGGGVWLEVITTFAGLLILCGAVNTAIVGGVGTINKMAADRTLPMFLMKRNRHNITTRSIVLFGFICILAIIFSKGNMAYLAEAYAFGVILAMVVEVLSVIKIGFVGDATRSQENIYRAPGLVGKVSLMNIFNLGVLLLVFATNLLTKEIATKVGVTATVSLVTFSYLYDYIRTRIMKQKTRAGVTTLIKENIYSEELEDIAREFIGRIVYLVSIARLNPFPPQLQAAIEEAKYNNATIIILSILEERNLKFQKELLQFVRIKSPELGIKLPVIISKVKSQESIAASEIAMTLALCANVFTAKCVFLGNPEKYHELPQLIKYYDPKIVIKVII